MTYALVSGQSASNPSTVATGANAPVTLAAAPTAGNLAVVGTIIFNGTVTGCTVTDANGKTYSPTTSSPNIDNAGSAISMGIFSLEVPSGASATINVVWAFSGGGNASVDCFAGEWSGNAASSPLEQDSPGTNTSNTLSLTTTNNGDLLFGLYHDNGSISGAGSPWTLLGSIIGSANGAEYFVQSAAGAQGINFTGSSGGRSMIAAFKAAGGGATYFPFNGVFVSPRLAEHWVGWRKGLLWKPRPRRILRPAWGMRNAA